MGEAIHLHRSGLGDSLQRATLLGEWIETTIEALERFSAELTFRTSGSTGQPKWCVHALVDLEAEVEFLARLVGAGRRVISVVPSHHVYGFLFTVLLPARLAAQVRDVRALAPSQLAEFLEAGDVVIGYPDYWKAFVRTVPAAAAGVTGVTSTAPCPSDVAAQVVARGIGRLIDVYGSSETAGIGWRADPGVAYEVFEYWRRGATDSELVRTLPNGAERVVTGPDRLSWEDARHLRPIGRRDAAVQVGGVNVFPDQIAARLCAHPGVGAAAVRLMLPAEGDRLKAFVVPQRPDADADALRADLWSWIDVNFSAPERPKSIVVGTELPTGELGKSANWIIPGGG